MVGRVLICTAASAALVLTPALALADNGGGLSAQELAQQAKKNFLDARSVRLKLTDHSAGASRSRTRPTFMDLALDRDGNCVGTVRTGDHGGSVELIKRGQEVWMKPDTAFWKAQVPGPQGSLVAELFKGRYIHGTTNDAMLQGLAGICSLTVFQQQLGGGPSAAGKSLTKGAETKADGMKVIPLKGVEDGRRAVLYVTSATPHLLVRATQQGGGTDTALTCTDYNKPVPSATPSPDETVDIGRLQQRLQNV